MRQFKLINASGEEFNLMDKSAFFYRPGGLGFARVVESVPTGSDWLETKEELTQQRIDGEMVFDKYSVYTDFARFCAHQPLTLCYAPAGKWWYRQCKLDNMEKGEFGEIRRLVCPVSFLCLSKWYDNAVIGKAQPETGQTKTYKYTYPYTYSESLTGAIRIDNTGTEDAACKLHIMGPTLNPSWALSSKGEVTLRGAVTCDIPHGHKLVVDSIPSTMEIAEYTTSNQFVRNLYGKSDFSTARFISVPPGISTISFSHKSTGPIDTWVEVRVLASTV